MKKYDIYDTTMGNIINMAGTDSYILAALISLTSHYKNFDPKSIYQEDTPLVWISITFPNIQAFYEVFTKLCDQSLNKTFILIRATQMGIVGDELWTTVCCPDVKDINFSFFETYIDVKKKLPELSFNFSDVDWKHLDEIREESLT